MLVGMFSKGPYDIVFHLQGKQTWKACNVWPRTTLILHGPLLLVKPERICKKQMFGTNIYFDWFLWIVYKKKSLVWKAYNTIIQACAERSLKSE